MHYYKFNVGDFVKDTAHLSLQEEGIYRRLIDLYYTTESPLIDDIKYLARLIRARDCIDDIQVILGEFFVLSGELWHHKRIDDELEKIYLKSEKARESAKKRWKTKENGCERNANAMRKVCESNATHNTLHTTQDTLHTKDIVESLQYLNNVTGRKFKKSSELSARLKEYSIDDIKLVIDYKAREWMGGDMQKYLRPQTLFNSTKFESYLNDAKQGIPHEKQQRTNQPNNKQQVEQYFSDPNNLRDF